MRYVIAIAGIGQLVGCPPEPPVAKSDVLCLDTECQALQLDATASVDADQWEWYLDGALAGTGQIFQMDVGVDTLREIELVVSNPSGSDSTMLYALGSTLVPADPTTPDPGGIVASVVASVTACDTNAVVLTVGGCFSAPGPVEQRFRVINAQGTRVHSLTYDKQLDDVTAYGDAEAAAWQNVARGGALGFGPTGGPLTSLNYGSSTYPQLANSSQDHLTSYVPVLTGDILEFQGRHLTYLEDPELQPLNALRVDCSAGGRPTVQMVPADY